MPSVIARIIAKVTALLPEDWVQRPGQRLRQTIDAVSGGQDLTAIAAEGASRIAVGYVSRDHAHAEMNYAAAEDKRIESELKRRTLGAQVRQEDAKAEQEEMRARIMRLEELHGRLKWFDECEKHNAVAFWDRNHNMHIIKAPPGFDWDAARTRLFNSEELLLADPAAEIDPTEPR